ncbi:unnamed protein product [Ophioblennius macclurei]
MLLLALCLVLLLCSSSVTTESVRETETWMPMKHSQTGAAVEVSGDAPNGSDFGFADSEDEYADTLYDDEDEYEEFCGSGSEDPESSGSAPSFKPDANHNRIPEPDHPPPPTVDQLDPVHNDNEIPVLRSNPEPTDEFPSNVLMAHASDDSILNRTEVLAALIAGGAVCLMLSVLLVLLLVHRMKKKDEGSYDLGKKPIYKKAPTTEIYA